MKNLIVFYLALTCTINIMFLSGCKTEEKRELSGYKFENEYVEVNTGETDLFTGDLTIDMYFKLHSYPTRWTFIISKFQSESQNEFSLRMRDKNNGRWFYGDGSYVNMNWNPKKHIALNEWVRLTAVRDISNAKMQVFVNGEKVSKRVFSSLAKAIQTDRNIIMLYENGRTLEATIAEVRIWNKALTMNEINSTANAIRRPARQSNLAGYWIFDEVENNIVKDHSSQGWDAVIKEN